MLSEFILLMFFTYFLMVDKSDMLAGLFVVMMTPSFVRWMKSAMMSDLMFFRYLLMLVMLELAELMINLVFDLAMGIIICFLNGPLVVMLILGFLCSLLLFVTLMILSTSSADNSGKVSLIRRMSLTLREMLAFEACTYGFLTLACTEVFLLTTFLGLLTRNEGREDIPGEDVVLEGATTDDGGSGVTVVFLGTDDNILVSPVFWEPKIFSRNFLMVIVCLSDLCLQKILAHLDKTDIQIRSLICSAITSNPSEAFFPSIGLYCINISILLINKAMLWMSSDLDSLVSKIDMAKCDPLHIAG